MAGAGYSGTPLIKKLGIKEEMKVLLIDPPTDYFSLLGTDISKQVIDKKQIPDLIHVFVKNNIAFESAMQSLKPYLKKNNKIIIWVSWYKKSAGIKTDITEDTIRNYALKNELVDIKVCAVSEIWSGLKVVVPVSKRI